MECKDVLNRYSLVWCWRKKPIMQRDRHGYFQKVGTACGVLVKREHLGETWYHYPEDYLQWKARLMCDSDS